VTVRRIEYRAAIRDREERMRAILSTAVDAIITIDRRGIIQQLNPATEVMFGYTRDELVGKNVRILMPEPYRQEHDGYLARYLETGQPRIIGNSRELLARHKDGSAFPIAVSLSEVDHLELFTGIIRDISDRKELQRQILEIAAEEDRKIGHELHDNIQQQLTGLGLLAYSLADTLADRSVPETELATRLAVGVNETARQVHLLSRGLVPVEVDADGLRASLTDLAAVISERYDVQCEFQSEGPVEVADNFMATHLYRIAQEAINNAIKHGKCESLDISLSGDNGSISLQVLDNGIGIGEKRSVGTGMGLRIMQYRAGLIGGTVQIEPAGTRGTMLSCKVPRAGVSDD
jgi:PAS domain S-box-containing protein